MTSQLRRRAAEAILLGLLSVLLLPGASASAATSAVTKSVTATRNHLVGGADQVVDTRTVRLSVSKTTNLRDRQEFDVTWSGAHPTGGIVADQNSGNANQEEYPVVLLQCRGIDSATASAQTRLDPSTCWTQTSGERYLYDFNADFPPWRLDRFAPVDARKASVGSPTPRPPTCSVPTAEYWVPFVAANGTRYYGGSNGCAGMAPEAANAAGQALPSNTTYGVTAPNGTGSAKFVVWTAENNASLGCSDTVPCSLVAVPIMGTSCDVAAAGLPEAERPVPGPDTDAAEAKCRATGKFKPGQIVLPVGGEDLAVSGALWWASSNWRNRITVPLDFAPLSNVCDLVGGGSSIDIYGSELMIQATTQWAPTFCLDRKRTRFKHVQTGEPQARSLIEAKTIQAGLVSDAPDTGYSIPVVNAPVAVTGFAIGYTVDTAAGTEYTSLKLTPRLLAKLLTESYPALPTLKETYEYCVKVNKDTVCTPTLAHNPLDMSLDPEFRALNPGFPTDGVNASQTASTLLALSSDSDVTKALTSYINADPEARAWLDGKPDPWGMVVNPNYKQITLPLASWPQLDTFKVEFAPGINDCLRGEGNVPYLPLVAAPLSRMSQITPAMQYSLANSQTQCFQPVPDSTEGQKLVSLGRQTPGFRFMLGVIPLADAYRYQIRTAALETQTGSHAAAKFTSASGRSFVAPNPTSVKAAAVLAKPDGPTGTWPIPYAGLRTSAKAAAAYPGTMIVYAAAPTKGLPSAAAKAVAAFIQYAATTGQTPGDSNGQLPEGYLPMTASNGLAALSSYAQVAATAIADQNGTVPSNVPASSASDSGGSGGGGSGTGTGSQPSPATVSPSAAPSASGKSIAAPVTAPVSLGYTTGQDSGLVRLVLPAVLVLALLGVVLAPATSMLARRRAER